MSAQFKWKCRSLYDRFNEWTDFFNQLSFLANVELVKCGNSLLDLVLIRTYSKYFSNTANYICCMQRTRRYSLFLYSCLILGFICPHTAEAQQYNHVHYDMDDGLISNEVYSSFQDFDGSMLFGTDRGLQRFDGETFFTVPFKSPHLSNSTAIFNIVVDSTNKRVWVNTYRNGLFYIKNDTLYPHPYNSKIVEINDDRYIGAIAFDEGDYLYFYFAQAFDQFIYKLSWNGQLEVITHSKCLEKRSLEWKDYESLKDRECFAFAPKGKLLFWKHLTINSQNPNRKNLSRFYNQDSAYVEKVKPLVRDTLFQIYKLPNSFSGQGIVNTFAHTKSQNISWLGDALLVSVVDTNYKVLANLNIGESIQELDNLEDGIIASTLNGAYFLKFDGKSIIKSDLLPNEQVSSSTVDSEGGVWITSPRNGIFYLPARIFKSPDNKSVGDNEIRQVNSDNFFVATIDGSWELKLLGLPDFELLYSQKEITSNYIYIDDEYFQTARVKGVYFENKAFNFSEHDEQGLSDVYGVSDNDTLIVGTSFLGYNQKLKGKKDFLHPITSYSFMHCVHKFKGTTYAGVDEGLITISWSSFGSTPFLQNQIKNTPKDIKNTSNRLIVSTRGGGVFICSQDSVLHNLSERNSILPNVCNKIAVQNDSTFWVASLKGLFRVSYKSHSDSWIPELFNVDVGLKSNRINGLSISRDMLFIGTVKGLCYAELKDLKISKTPISFTLSAPNLEISKLGNEDTLSLVQGKRDVYLQVDKKSFRHKENLLYSYVLNHNDSNTVLTSNNNLYFSNLQPGLNQVELNMATANRLWNPEPLVLNVWVPPYLYEKTWFQLTVGLGLAISILGGLFLLFRRLDKDRKRRFDFSMAQYNALSLQLSPHFIFNSLNNIQHLSVSENYITVNHFVDNLAQLTRNILEHSKLQLIPLKTEIDNLQLFLYIEEIRFEHKPIEVDFTIDPKLDLENLLIPPMIVQPSVENAIWHGLLNKEGERNLSITFSSIKDGFKVEIIDNGIGLNTKQKGEIKVKGKTSVGVKNTKSRIQLYNEMKLGSASFTLTEIQDEDNKPLGTSVLFLFYPSQHSTIATTANEDQNPNS